MVVDPQGSVAVGQCLLLWKGTIIYLSSYNIGIANNLCVIGKENLIAQPETVKKDSLNGK